MTYELGSSIVLFEIDRTALVDISVGDTIKACCLSDAVYQWTEQDAQFMENNPDARLFIKFERSNDDVFRGIGVTVVPQEVY